MICFQCCVRNDDDAKVCRVCGHQLLSFEPKAAEDAQGKKNAEAKWSMFGRFMPYFNARTMRMAS